MLTIKRILAPTDLSELSKDAIRAALDLAKSHGARVTVYNVLEPDRIFPHGPAPHPEAVAQVVEERKKLLTHFVNDNFAGVITAIDVCPDVEAGVAYRKILDRAADESSDLIVLSTHGETGMLHGLIGGVAELIVRLAPCPVLSVHPAMRHAVETKAA